MNSIRILCLVFIFSCLAIPSLAAEKKNDKGGKKDNKNAAADNDKKADADDPLDDPGYWQKVMEGCVSIEAHNPDDPLYDPVKTINALDESTKGIHLDVAGDKLVAALARFKSLELLWISDATVLGDAGYENIAKLSTLKHLNLMRVDGLSDVAVASLNKLSNLVTFYCSCSAELKQIGKLEKLTNLSTGVTDVPDATFAELKKLKNLRFLELNAAYEREIRNSNPVITKQAKMTDAGLVHIGAIPSLRGLELCNFPLITDTGVTSLENLSKLRYLEIHMTSWESFAPKRTITDTTLKSLSKLKELRWLRLPQGTQITDKGLVHLKALDKLELLGLSCTSAITDTGIESLLALKTLKSLEVDLTGITAKGYEKLKAGLPNCQVS